MLRAWHRAWHGLHPHLPSASLPSLPLQSLPLSSTPLPSNAPPFLSFPFLSSPPLPLSSPSPFLSFHPCFSPSLHLGHGLALDDGLDGAVGLRGGKVDVVVELSRHRRDRVEVQIGHVQKHPLNRGRRRYSTHTRAQKREKREREKRERERRERESEREEGASTWKRERKEKEKGRPERSQREGIASVNTSPRAPQRTRLGCLCLCLCPLRAFHWVRVRFGASVFR